MTGHTLLINRVRAIGSSSDELERSFLYSYAISYSLCSVGSMAEIPDTDEVFSKLTNKGTVCVVWIGPP